MRRVSTVSRRYSPTRRTLNVDPGAAQDDIVLRGLEREASERNRAFGVKQVER